MYSDKTNINILTALLVRHGVRHAVVCPGSRNAPIVHNLNECPDITCHPVTDEKSAGFIALGLRQQLSEPVAVCVTSGSALLNLHPAVAEASYRHQGIIVISADRPQAWIGQMDGQTMPQNGALGDFVAKSFTLPEPVDEVEIWQCNRLVNEALMECERPSHPCVHINVTVSEPLFNFNVDSLPDVRCIRRCVWGKGDDEVISSIRGARRPMLVFGQLPYGIRTQLLKELAGKAAVLVEPLAGSTGEPSFAEQAMYVLEKMSEEYRPDLVIYSGGNTVSKRLRRFLRTECRNACHITVSEDGSLHDISCNTSVVIETETECFLNELNGLLPDSGTVYAALWNSMYDKIGALHDSFVPEYSQMQAVRLFENTVNDADTVHYANSMPLRMGAVYANHFIWCNRGLNGIEGSISTAVGAAVAKHCNAGTAYDESRVGEGRLFCVTGDLSFFYDSNALWSAAQNCKLRILLLNNAQGGIFKSLPGLQDSPAAAAMVSGKHSLNAECLCAHFGVGYIRAENQEELERGMKEFSDSGKVGPLLLEVLTDASTDQRVYSDYFKHIVYGMEKNI